jgi:hypothetical protein
MLKEMNPGTFQNIYEAHLLLMLGPNFDKAHLIEAFEYM